MSRKSSFLPPSCRPELYSYLLACYTSAECLVKGIHNSNLTAPVEVQEALYLGCRSTSDLLSRE